MTDDQNTVVFQVPTQISGTLNCTEGSRKGQSWPLTAGTFTLGRSMSCDLVMTDENGVSKVHAKIFAEGNRYKVLDADSRNGTFVNGKPQREAFLKSGDTIQICDSIFRIEVSAVGESVEQAPAGELETLTSRDAGASGGLHKDPTAISAQPSDVTDDGIVELDLGALGGAGEDHLTTAAQPVASLVPTFLLGFASALLVTLLYYGYLMATGSGSMNDHLAAVFAIDKPFVEDAAATIQPATTAPEPALVIDATGPGLVPNEEGATPPAEDSEGAADDESPPEVNPPAETDPSTPEENAAGSEGADVESDGKATSLAFTFVASSKEKRIMKARTSGTVKSVLVEEGGAVRAGAKIATVGSRATVTSAEVEELTETVEALKAVVAASGSESAKAELARERSRLSTLRRKSKSSTSNVSAPSSGTVAAVAVSVGDKVRAGAKVAEIVITTKDRLLVTSAKERELAVGDTLRLKAGATEGTGTVARVYRTGTKRQAVIEQATGVSSLSQVDEVFLP